MHEENNYVTVLFARDRKGNVNSKIKWINLPAMYQKQRNNASVSTKGKKKKKKMF